MPWKDPSSLVFRAWELIIPLNLCSFLLQVEVCTQLLIGHFERQSHISVNFKEDNGSRKIPKQKELSMSLGFGWLLLTTIGEHESFWLSSILILNFPLIFKLWAHLAPSWPQVHMQLPLHHRSLPALFWTRWRLGPGLGQHSDFWEPNRFKMSLFVKQLPILFPCRAFLTSGKIVSGSYVHFMAAYVLKSERWLGYPVSPGSSSELAEFYLHHILWMGHNKWFVWTVWASELS